MKKVLLFSVITILIVFSSQRLTSQDLQTGIKLTRSEQFRKADLIYKSIIRKTPKNGNAWFYYGENFLQKYFSDTLTYSIKEMADSAGNVFRSGIDAEVSNPLNYVGIGEVGLISKKQTEAESDFEKALSLLPSKSNKSSSVSKQDQAVVYIRIANAYLKARVNDTSKVFPLLRRAEQLDNKNFDLYIVKGDCYMQLLNDGSTAIKNYNKAQMLNPLSPRAKLRLGQLWVKAHNYPSALQYYSEAIKIDSNYAPAYREMGYLLAKTNQHDLAKKSFGKFLSLSAGNKMSRIQYINILFDLQDYAEAINQINIVISKDSSNNDFNRALGYAYYETGQFEKGLYYMAKFFDNAEPGKTRTADFVYYGKLLAKNNKDSIAGAVLMKAYDMDTTQTELLNQAISAYLKVKDYGKAAEIVIRKTMIKKDVATDYYLLGKLYYNLQEYQKADSVFAINVSMDPGNIKGYLWKAYSLVNLDPDGKEGLAKPAFEMLVEKAEPDTAKYRTELIEAYSYLSYYYLLKFVKTKDQKEGAMSKGFCAKILALDPANEKAKTLLKELAKSLKQ